MNAKRALASVAFIIGLFAAGMASSGNKTAVAVNQSPPAEVDVAPVLIKHVRHWDEFNGRIKRPSNRRYSIQSQWIAVASPRDGFLSLDKAKFRESFAADVDLGEE